MIEAMKQARNAFVWNLNTDLDNIPACEQWAKMLRKNIDALDKAIAEAEKQDKGCQRCDGKGCIACDAREQEPVLWVMPDGKTVDKWGLQFYGGQTGTPLYTHPQPKPEQDADELLNDTQRAYERGFIDGMQKQMQSSVDKAVNVMSKREWVGLTDDEIDQGLLRSDYALQTAHAWRAGVVFAMTQLKEKNNV